MANRLMRAVVPVVMSVVVAVVAVVEGVHPR